MAESIGRLTLENNQDAVSTNDVSTTTYTVAELFEIVKQAYNILSFVVAAASSIYNMWKNNNFTPAAKAGQKVLDAIKSGKLSAEQVEKWLGL